MSVTELRSNLASDHFPHGIPKLWCPTVTHFTKYLQADFGRFERQWSNLRGHVRGILLFGTTGEGWDLSDEAIHEMLMPLLNIAAGFDQKVLVGVLKARTDDMTRCIAGLNNVRRHPSMAGIVVCAPRGPRSQTALADELRVILDLGWPTALYQLPQITGNLLTPNTVASLASSYSNFLFFKDSSGDDLVARSALDFRGVFFLQGAEKREGSASLKAAGGYYDGLLLSSANVFYREYAQILRLIEQGLQEQASSLCAHLSVVTAKTFALASNLPWGNPFANANKALDHCMAYGSGWREAPAPVIHTGDALPHMLIAEVASLLETHALLPEQGYLAT